MKTITKKTLVPEEIVERRVDWKPYIIREFVCTKEDPWTKEKVGSLRTIHPDAESHGDEYGSFSNGGSYEKFVCPHCGKYFTVELPD